jgi:phosphoglycerol transferase MdoB-like AlkP superfamily enzyme
MVKLIQFKMKKRLTALVSYALFWLLFFITARMIFIFTHITEASHFGIGEIASTFLHGLKLDISAIGYIFLLPVLFMIPGVYFNGSWYRVFMKWYTYVLIIISACIVVPDTLLYKYWGFRMDYTVLLYLKTPKEAAASVTFLQMSSVIAGTLLFILLFIWLYRKYIFRLFGGFNREKLWYLVIPFFMLLLGSLIIPIRGGTGLAPINAGTVYFSEDLFVNHTAVNVVWNVGSSLINRKPTKNPYEFGDLEAAKESIRSLTRDTGKSEKLLNSDRPNIIIFVMESFGSALIGPLGGDSLTSPNLNRLMKDGVVFTHFYSSGNRTDKAIPAILDGYPAQPANSIMKSPEKTQSLPSIVKKMIGLGYKCSFWYGGEINFANFNSFVINNGFTSIITMKNFDPKFYNSKWGVHDHILLRALRDSMKNIREPFLKVVLTLSSHEPFEVPMEPVFKGNDELTKFKNSIYYTDKSLGEFLDWAKGTEWWDNTLVVLVADHCRRNSNDDLVYSEEIFKIPMIWLGGALAVHGVKIAKTGDQVDIPITLLHQMNLDDNYPFSKDLLSDGTNSFAFYSFNEGFGFITDSSKYIYDHKPGKAVVEDGKDPDSAGKLGKDYLQVLYDDFLKR